MTRPITDLEELHLGSAVYREVEAPGDLPQTTGWMHSGCAITRSGIIAVAHPEGRQLLLIDRDRSVRAIPVNALEMHTIYHDPVDEEDTLWLVNNGHRFVRDRPDYAHYREHGSVTRIALDGTVLQTIDCPDIDAYRDERWQPTSLCRGADGTIWIADGYGLDLVHQFTQDGHHIRTIDASETGLALACPHGIARRGEQILVADRTNRRILVLEDGVVIKILDAPLTSPSSLLVLGEHLLVTELHGGIAVFDGDRYVGHFARDRDDPTRDAWPNDRDSDGNTTRPTVDERLHSPHGIASDGERIIVTEWFIGGRLHQYTAIR
ncbi:MULTISPECIES: hypothetical protein [unclassified Microbacterium]|uniref:hypothetical protein n=1 Tax=Microbacterium TaxID=33882 RepID=UPI003BA2733C